MLNIMIVEDEPPIARSLKNMIESLSSSYSVLSNARNGREALSLLEHTHEKINVLFTDIRMPVMDGLTLMKEVNDRYPSITIVVLSGYKDFSYVQKALRYKALDYLLKPVNKENLSVLLNKLDCEINKQKENEFAHQIQLLLAGTSARNLQIIPNHSSYLVILICAGSFPLFSADRDLPGHQFWKTNDLASLLSDARLPGMQTFSFSGKTCAEKIVVVSLTRENSAFRPNTDINTWYMSLFSALKKTEFPVTMVVSDPLSDISQIEDIAYQLRVRLNKSLVIGMSQIVTMDETNIPIPAKKSFLADKENALKGAILSNNKKEFQDILQSLFQFFEIYKYPQCLVEHVLNRLIHKCCCDESFEKIQLDNLMFDINKAAAKSLSYGDFYDNVVSVLEEAFYLPEDINRSRKLPSKLQTDIEAYLKEHYAENITNATLSKKFNLVPSYLTKLFKSYTGVTPQQYLTTLRIERAKRIIEQNPKRLLKDIALDVGFTDPLYFSRIFKKETNYSPADYKKLCEQRRK